MFLNNKYTSWYNSLVSKAKSRNLDKKTSSVYLEKHHIIPKSINGSNSKDNLVLLTAKEHFVAHRLLTKMTTGDAKRKMSMAMFCMITANKTGRTEKIVSSNVYEQVRTEYSKIVSGEKHFNRGIIRSEETKNKLRIAKTKQKPFSKEHYDNMAKIMTGKLWINDGVKNRRVYKEDINKYVEQGFTEGRIPYNYTEEYRKKQSENSRAQWQKFRENKLAPLTKV